MKNIKIIPLS